MVTGYEVETYRNIGRIAAALDRIADALEAQSRAAEADVRDEYQSLLDRHRRAAERFTELDRRATRYSAEGQPTTDDHRAAIREADQTMQEAEDALLGFEARHPEVVP